MPHISRAITLAEKHLKAASEHLTCPTASTETLIAARRELLQAIGELMNADRYIGDQIDAQTAHLVSMAGRRFTVVR